MVKKDINWIKVLLIGGFTVVYVLSPIDAIPYPLPFNEIDDSAIAFIAAWLLKD